MELDLFRNFYNGKRVLITGHTGFKGSWLAIWLYELGAEVIGISLEPYSSRDNFVLSGIKDKIIDLVEYIEPIKDKDFKFYQIFNPKKALSKSGKSLSIAIALGFLIGQIAIPIFKSKKQTGK